MAAAAGYAQLRIAEIDHARASAATLRIGVVQGNIALAEANALLEVFTDGNFFRMMAEPRAPP